MPTTEIAREYKGSTIPAAGTYVFDPVHSVVSFSVRHMMVSKVRGKFAFPQGEFVIADDPLQSAVEVDLDASSIETGDAQRDGHLKSPDFLDVDRFPKLTFKSTHVRHVNGDKWELVGDLTIKDVTRPVTLDLEVSGAGKDPWGNVKVGFEATTKINRDDWGLSYNAVLETGGVLIGKDITIELAVEAAAKAD
jgi:polyisoprenoid-binding protein YceI